MGLLAKFTKNIDLNIADGMLKKMFKDNKITSLMVRMKEDGSLEYLNSEKPLQYVTIEDFYQVKKTCIELMEENLSLKSELKNLEI